MEMCVWTGHSSSILSNFGRTMQSDMTSGHLAAGTWKPQKGPKAAVTHATYPLFSGNVVASSAVIRASGTLHTRGKIRKPMMARRGPPALTASYRAEMAEIRNVRASPGNSAS